MPMEHEWNVDGTLMQQMSSHELHPKYLLPVHPDWELDCQKNYVFYKVAICQQMMHANACGQMFIHPVVVFCTLPEPPNWHIMRNRIFIEFRYSPLFRSCCCLFDISIHFQ
jgi:hypothetical protein